MFDDNKSIVVKRNVFIGTGDYEDWQETLLPKVSITEEFSDRIKFNFQYLYRIITEHLYKKSDILYLELIDGSRSNLATYQQYGTTTVSNVLKNFSDSETVIDFTVLNNSNLSSIYNLDRTFLDVKRLIKVTFPTMPSVNTLYGTFQNCSRLEDVNMDAFPNLTQMNSTFADLPTTGTIESKQINLHRTDFSKVTSARKTFYYARNVPSFLGLDFSSLLYADEMFFHCPSTVYDLSSFVNLENANSMFSYTNIESITFPEKCKITNGTSMFSGSVIKNCNKFDFPYLTNGTEMFYNSRVYSDSTVIVNCPSLQDATRMFKWSGIRNVSSDNDVYWDISSFRNVTISHQMFDQTDINIYWGFDTSTLNSSAYMFGAGREVKILVNTVLSTSDTCSALLNWLSSTKDVVYPDNNIENISINYTFPLQHSGPETCQLVLATLPDNTPETPYELWGEYIYSESLIGDLTTPKPNTYQYVLQQNPTKYVSLDLAYSPRQSGQGIVNTTDYGFYNCKNLVSFTGSSDSTITSAQYMFSSCSNLINVNGDFLEYLTDMYYGLAGTPFEYFDTSSMKRLKNASYLFASCKK